MRGHSQRERMQVARPGGTPAKRLATPGQDHWFDTFTTRLAADGPSRRKVIVGALGFAASTLWTRSAGGFGDGAFAAETLTQPPMHQPILRNGAMPGLKKGKPAVRPAPRAPISQTIGPCSFQQDTKHGAFTYAGEVSVNNKPLRLTIKHEQQIIGATVSAHTAASTVVTEISYGSDSVVRISSRTNPTTIERNAVVSGAIDVSCGPLVTGLRTASLTFQGGKVSGTVNGKAIASAPISSGLQFQSLRFADGSNVPTPEFDKQLQSAIPQLKAKADAEVKTCFSGSGRLRPRFDDPDAPGSDNTWQNLHEAPAQTPECQGCFNTCYYNFGVCCAAAAVSTLGAALPACDGELASCLGTCFLPGNGCGKNFCHSLGTCDDNQQCCGSQVCCGPTNVSVCGTQKFGECCPADSPVGCGDETGIICFPPNFICCPVENFFPKACPPNTVCISVASTDGACCPTNLFCDGVCCPTGTTCQKTAKGTSLCCNMPLCGDVCCNGPNEVCVNGRCGIGQPCGNTFCGISTPDCCNGVCCERGKCCNNICCSSTQTCVNGKCTTPSNDCDPRHQVPCGPVCCRIQDTCCEATHTCCPPNTMCCGAKGCQPANTSDCIQ